MQYFFILGNNPTLSCAELMSFFSLAKNQDTKIIATHDNFLILEFANKLNIKEIIQKIGGTIKIGEVLGEASNIEIIQKQILKLDFLDLAQIDYKFKFGISVYGGKFNSKRLAMEFKRELREREISVRWVISREPNLSSVVVTQNKLIDLGIEIVVMRAGGKIIFGRTLAVQDFKALSRRDYGRPARDDKSGMLPPKLAQIMINLSGASHKDTLLDPFCGSGTILSEAMLMGYEKLIGSDLSRKAINDTRQNLDWICEEFKLNKKNLIKAPEPGPKGPPNYQLINHDAQKISETIKANSIDAIITEPYLGPQRGYHEFRKTISELEILYTNFLKEAQRILKPSGHIVMIWPIFLDKKRKSKKFLHPKLGDFKIKNIFTLKNLDFKINLSFRKTMIYGRANQKVWREIVILE